MEYIRIKSRKDLSEWLAYEKKNYGLGKKNMLYAFAEKTELYEIWRFQKALRKAEYSLNCGKRISFLIRKRRLNTLANKYGLHILPNVFGKGLKIMHLGSVLTNSNARCGENLSVHIDTAIVAGGSTPDTPKLGNNIVIGVGAKIVGGVELADDIAVGAGAVVTKSFKEESVTIAGVPAVKISDNGRSKWNPSDRKE